MDWQSSLSALGAAGVAMTALWAVSVRLRDASVIDAVWGPGFALVAAWTMALGGGSPRGGLVAALVAVWGVRLGVHIWTRNAGHGEDPRYRAMRAQHGARFWWVSLFTVFWLQAALLWVVSLPVQFVQLWPAQASWGWLDWVAALVWAVGFSFQTIGDAQLRAFKADPANRGKVLDRGLWRYTRHPNYFGDFLVWWGFYLFALAAGGSGWWTALGPLVMSVLLMRVSGVTLLEKGLHKSRPGYAEYVQRTSAFFPRPPKG